MRNGQTAGRLLRLLSLLQTRREWPGAELADRLEVSPRTVRLDVERLRDLGYPVHAARGTAVATGLRAAASGVVGGIEESLLRALTKIERVLPSRLRHRVNTPQLMTVRVPSNAPKIEASTLTTIASACREHEQLRFDYSDHAQARSRRGVEPYRLVGWGRR